MEYLRFLHQAYKKAENKDKAQFAKKYLRNQFESFGIMSPERKEIYRLHFIENGIPEIEDIKTIVMHCFDLPHREYHYFALELLYRARKNWNEDIIEFFEELITCKSWWDTVDGIAPTLIAEYFKLFPENRDEFIKSLAHSDNFWKQRSSIIFQLKAGKITDKELLKYCILQNSSSNEFFVQKAIGWALRQYSRHNSDWVINFIETNNLKPLSKREGLKWMINKGLYND